MPFDLSHMYVHTLTWAPSFSSTLPPTGHWASINFTSIGSLSRASNTCTSPVKVRKTELTTIEHLLHSISGGSAFISNSNSSFNIHSALLLGHHHTNLVTSNSRELTIASLSYITSRVWEGTGMKGQQQVRTEQTAFWVVSLATNTRSPKQTRTSQRGKKLNSP